MSTYTDHRVLTNHPAHRMNSRAYDYCARYEVTTWNGRTILIGRNPGMGFAARVGRFPITEWAYFRPACPSLGMPESRGTLTRDEVASMLRQCRRTNLNPAVIRKNTGVMKQCPRTTCNEWSRPH